VSYYKCGHEQTLIVVDASAISMSAYIRWKKWAGDRIMCFDCWCEKQMRTTQKGGD